MEPCGLMNGEKGEIGALQTLSPFASRLLCAPDCLLTALNIYPQVPEPQEPLKTAGPRGSSEAGPALSLPWQGFAPTPGTRILGCNLPWGRESAWLLPLVPGQLSYSLWSPEDMPLIAHLP